MPLFDMIFVAGVALAFASLIAALAFGVHQTRNLPMSSRPAARPEGPGHAARRKTGS